MTDEWVEKKVNEIEKGDFVLDIGEIEDVKLGLHVCSVKATDGSLWTGWPSHAKVLVKAKPRRPVVEILPISTNAGSWRVNVWNPARAGSEWWADFRKQEHAEFFAEQLRNGTIEP